MFLGVRLLYRRLGFAYRLVLIDEFPLIQDLQSDL